VGENMVFWYKYFVFYQGGLMKKILIFYNVSVVDIFREVILKIKTIEELKNILESMGVFGLSECDLDYKPVCRLVKVCDLKLDELKDSYKATYQLHSEKISKTRRTLRLLKQRGD
jgi:hypothetical protein